MNGCHEIKRFGLTWGEGTDQATPIILGNYVEAVGPLYAIDYEGGALVATIGAIKVILPPEMAEELKPYVGQKIGILRADSTERPYRIRTFSEVRTDA